MKHRHIKRAAALLAATVALGASQQQAFCDTNTVGGYLYGVNNWYATNVYVMTNYTYVMSNAVLNIEAGTVVKGRDGTAPNFGSLFVTRGGKLFAIGTPEKPIIFTAEADDVNNPFDTISDLSLGYTRGKWGGIVLLGNALINNSVNGSSLAPMYDVYEGLIDTVVSGEAIHRFGGTDDGDNSGTLHYVSIRHGGKVLESAKEINGLSLGAVGSNTVIDHVESYCIADDGFEFFGGSVNTKYLVSAFNDDDGFDTDQGYHGKNQFLFVIQEPGAKDSGSEQNGQPNPPTPVIPGSTPLANYQVYNATMIGAGMGVGTGNEALNIRVQNLCTWANSVFTEFDGNRLDVDGTSTPTIQSNIFYNFVANGTGWATYGAPNNQTVNPRLRGISRIQANRLDPRPMIGSPVYSSVVTPADPFYTPVNYRGAFDCENWLRCWTALDQNLIVGSLYNVGSQTNLVGGLIYGTTNVWYATNVYIMTNYTYVMSNATLTIEPGTLVKGRDGSAPNFGSLFVTRGGKLFADGTACQPIIFTAEADDVNNPFDTISDLSLGYTRGKWGGIVLLGNALINNSVNGSSLAPMYDVYEGLIDTVISGEAIHRFGGTDDGDNSGTLRYVSIRHGGKVLESAKEINGLSLGAVGSNTVVEHIESYCIADDGFEFFGGSVNTKYLVSAFNDDDGFDTDQGYHGKNQFLFVIQEPGAKDSGSEQNGQPNPPTPVIPGSTPLANYQVYNATMIGAGMGVGTGNEALNIRVQNLCTWANSVFTEFDGNRLDVDGTSTPTIQSNIFFNFVANGTGWATYGAPNNQTVNPMLNKINRQQFGILDPRPDSGSPVYSSVVTPADPFYAPVTYRGAFNTANWALDWTALSANGILTGCSTPELVVVAPPNPVTLSITLNGANADIRFATQSGYSYMLQTNAPLNGTWGDAGPGVSGTGGTMLLSRPLSADEQYFRVVAQ